MLASREILRTGRHSWRGPTAGAVDLDDLVQADGQLDASSRISEDECSGCDVGLGNDTIINEKAAR